MSELQPTELRPDEVLYIPKRKRLTHGRFKGDDGNEVLHLFYGDVELVFDEPDIAPLGEKLIEVEQFKAEDAMAWSNDIPHSWEKVRELLTSLIEAQILSRVTEASASRVTENFPQRLGEAPEDRQPMTYSAHDDKCPVITEQAFGRAFDLSNLEVLVPIYRIAHPALDADGRQVGENNVSPRTLFLDLPTQRRLCNFPGSRYQQASMNVTAMKAMSRKWPELLSLTEQFRRAVVERISPRDPKQFTAGELHLIAVTMLASVGYVMVRGKDPVPNGQLDSGLASMFRLVDGVRLVTNDLVRAEADSQGCEAPVSAQSITTYADRHEMYKGPHGVCAGPAALIDEYMQILMAEAPAPIEAEPNVAERLGDLQASIDYGLLGQRIESVVRYLGSVEGLLHERLRAAFAGRSPVTALQELVDAPIDEVTYPLMRRDFSLEVTFQREIDLSRWLFRRAGEALVGMVDGASLDDLLALDPAEQEASKRRLAELFAHALSADKRVEEPLLGELASVMAQAFALERRCIRLVEREVAVLNERLARKPGRKLTNYDLAVYTRPRSGPPLAETLARGLGVMASTDATSTVVKLGDSSLTFTD